MALQCLLIRGRLIPEQRVELLTAIDAEGEYFAVVMTDLVAKVAKNSTVRLVHALPERFAVRVVALGQVKGDDAILVAGDDLPLTAGEQVESKTDEAVAHLDRKLQIIE